MKAKLSQYGEHSVLIEEFEGFPFTWIESLEQHFPNSIVRAGLESLVITFPDYGDHLSQVEAVIERVESKASTRNSKTVEIPTEYSGEDLELVAKTLGLTVAQVIHAHTQTLWTVKLIGFAPGFPYLVPIEENNVLSSIGRLESPRTKVPSGSVGIAAGMSCVYPSEMPGGWHLIGQTTVELFDAANSRQPTLLSIGDQVRFVEVNK
jgi:KipI family sensor histidine kinase inhibitor